MWVLQVPKDLVDLSKHFIHVIDALVSLDRAEYFALEKIKKSTQKQLHSSSKVVSLRSQLCRGIQMYKINFVSSIYASGADLFFYGHSLLHA